MRPETLALLLLCLNRIMSFVILLMVFIGLVVFVSEPAAVGRWFKEIVQYWR